MFGLTFEKLLLVAVVAIVIVGPAKLPLYASNLAALVKRVRNYAAVAKARVRNEVGPDFDEIEWKKLDPRLYDPRRIIRDALLEDLPPTRSNIPQANSQRMQYGHPLRISATANPSTPSPTSPHRALPHHAGVK